MAQDAFQVHPLEGDRLRIELRGDLTQEVAEALEATVQDTLRSLAAGAFDVIVDMRGLETSSVFARSVLVRVQKRIAAKARRTAYLADRARFRGLALWVIHLAEDDNAKSVMNEKGVEDWFRSSSPRLGEAQERTGLALAALAKGSA